MDDEKLGNDCLWSYIDARDVGTACLAWLESDLPGAEVFNLAARNVHQDVPVVELLKRHGYAGVDVPKIDDPHQTLFSTEKFRRMTGWNEQYHWKDMLT